jgi:proteic killer suppression protein
MIQTIRNKAIKIFYETGNGAKLPADQRRKIQRILLMLDAISNEDELKAIGAGIHQLQGNYEGYWSVVVSANWRILFRFVPPDVFDIDFVDYH